MIRSQGAVPEALPTGAEQARACLQRRADLLAAIRRYFAEQGLLEVETPLLGPTPVTDPSLENLIVNTPTTNRTANTSQPCGFLQTSPEYAMKQLLSLGSGSIYQLCKAFRDDPPGALHAREFTMLEWYRLDYDVEALIDDMAALLRRLLPERSVQRLHYADAFRAALGCDPHTADEAELSGLAKQYADFDANENKADRDMLFDLLFSHVVQPGLGRGQWTFVTNFPASQAALAKTRTSSCGSKVACRFELFIDGIELANGYDELLDAELVEQRFVADNDKRMQRGLPEKPVDEVFLETLRRGLPRCAGVAMGIDRLLLIQSQGQHNES